MRLYESVFISRAELSPGQVEALGAEFSNTLKELGASVEKVEYCGLRELAYPINKSNKGHYVIMNITAGAAALKELERQMGLREEVVRFLTVAVEAHETGSSLLAQQTRVPRESGFDHGNRRRGER